MAIYTTYNPGHTAWLLSGIHFCDMGNYSAISYITKSPPGRIALRRSGRWLLCSPVRTGNRRLPGELRKAKFFYKKYMIKNVDKKQYNDMICMKGKIGNQITGEEF